MKQKRFLVFGIAVGALALLGAVIWTALANYSPRSQRLPDGSFLKIVSVSCGTNHSFTLPAHKPWKHFLVAHLPPSFTGRLGWSAGNGSVGLAHQPGRDDVAIFTLCEKANPTSFSSPELVVADEQGVTYETVVEGAVFGSEGKHAWRLTGWKLSNVPLNSKRTVLRFSALAADGLTRQDVAEFSLPNPLARAARN